jgi:putative phage-type endonuclease
MEAATALRIAPPLALTEEQRREAWLAARREHITSSDLAAIMGLPDAYGSPMGVYLEKKGLLEKGEAPTYLEAGLRLQPVILEWYADKRGVAIEHADPYELVVCGAHPILAASLDARWHRDDRRPVDAKNVRIKRPDEWGPDGTDEIPARYVVQLHAQMLCAGVLQQADLATLFAGADPGWFTVPYDVEIGAAIVEAAATFWTKHVIADIPPPVDGTDEWTRFLASRQQKTQDYLEATPEALAWVQKMRDATRRKEAAEDEEKLAKNHIRAFIGEHAGLVTPLGKIHYKRNKNSVETDWQAIAQAYRERLLALVPQEKPLVDAVVEAKTTTKPGNRPLMPKLKEVA